MSVLPSPADLGYVSAPSAADLGRYLGWPLDVEQEIAAGAQIARAETLVRSYTRGRGFIGNTMAPPLAQVVLSLAGRTLANPTGDARVNVGEYSATPGQPDFTLNDRLVLDGYRRRTA